MVRYEGAYLSLESVGSSLETKIWSKVQLINWNSRLNLRSLWAGNKPSGSGAIMQLIRPKVDQVQRKYKNDQDGRMTDT